MAKVLIAIADPDEHGLAVFALRFAGYQISSITDFTDLFPQIDSSQPDLIVLDTQLPGLPASTTWKSYISVLKTYPVPLILVHHAGEEITFGRDFIIPVINLTRPITADHMAREVNRALKAAGKK